MTKQEIFNTVYNGLHAQNFDKSHDDELIVCRYRDDNGRKCAVGVLIPDELYNSEMETWGIGTLISRGIVDIGLPIDADDSLFADYRHFLSNLQSAHDGSCGGQDMQNLLRVVAHQHELTVPA